MPRDPGRRPPDDLERLEHMREAVADALGYAAGRDRDDLDRDSMLLRALINCIQVIGEAATQISEEGRVRAAELPWREMVKMRNVLVHVYWGIDHDRIWETVQQDLPSLAAMLERAIVGLSADE